MRSVIDANNCAICLFCMLTSRLLLLCEFYFFRELGAKDKYSVYPRSFPPCMEARDRRVGRLDDPSDQISKLHGECEVVPRTAALGRILRIMWRLDVQVKKRI